jgi:phytoene/squalene synthetase
MSHLTIVTRPLVQSPSQSVPEPTREPTVASSAALAAVITREASRQTYYTIASLVDRPLVADAYRAYAYFRWVDDVVDQGQLAPGERLAFLTRQQEIMTRCGQGQRPDWLFAEERLVADLVRAHPVDNEGLNVYLNQMMAVMVFDAERQYRLISQAELAEYTRMLATAVTEALHYFIGHHGSSPQDETRYLAVTGAHITHMLRDAVEDTAVGYFNIPNEFLETHGITPTDVNHNAYRLWVQERAQLARRCLAAGRTYLARVENRRCRLAGYAYIGRFELVLDLIEKDAYRLRPAYPQRKSKRAALKIGLAAFRQTIASLLPARPSGIIDIELLTESLR